MFIREKKSKDSLTSVIQIVENRRTNGITRQKVLRHVGTGHNAEEIAQLKRVALFLKDQLEQSCNHASIPKFESISSAQHSVQKGAMADISSLSEHSRLNVGTHEIYSNIYEQLGFGNLFTRPHQRQKAAKILREIVISRIANPGSKRSSVQYIKDQFGIPIKLDHVYQMMDKIDDQFCTRIQQRALSETLKLTGGKLQVLFYDATTLYFESFIEDDLNCNGYSKDLKFNQPQVLLALFVTSSGLPVGYELFPGNTFEGHTLLPVLEKIKHTYQLEEVIFVADRGLFSKDNLDLLEKKGFKYIVGSRIKNVNKSLEEQILDQSHYTEVIRDGSETNSFATFDQKSGRKLIVHYSSVRARKDSHDRSKAIEKLCNKLSKSKNPASLINNFGYKKYIAVSGNAKIGVDKSKIEKDARWDGLAGITSNIKDMQPKEILQHYRGLWQIEESFRINKHDLKMRPIYHWKPKRVRAHIAISFMAFVCVRHLEYRVAVQYKKISPEAIRSSLHKVQASILEEKSTGKRFLMHSKADTIAREIYRVMGVAVATGVTQIT